MSHYMTKILDELDRTEELLHKGLKEINEKGDLNASALEVLGNTLDGIKDLCEIKGTGLEMIEEYGYPQRGRNSRRSYGYDGYSRNEYQNRYSGDDMFNEELRRRMDNAKTEQEREIIRSMMR